MSTTRELLSLVAEAATLVAGSRGLLERQRTEGMLTGVVVAAKVAGVPTHAIDDVLADVQARQPAPQPGKARGKRGKGLVQ